jgi:capsular polysaccharide biosynthesis protein
MLADMLPLISQSDTIAGMRHSLASAFGIDTSNSPRREVPNVCYINRSRTTRRLDADSEIQLEQALSSISGVRFKNLFMEDYSFQEQFRIVYSCHVLIGVHGNGLTHGLWVPDNATVIEIFPYGTHTLDYEFIAIARGAGYYAYDAVEGPLRKEERYTNTPRGGESLGRPFPLKDAKRLAFLVMDNLSFS